MEKQSEDYSYNRGLNDEAKLTVFSAIPKPCFVIKYYGKQGMDEVKVLTSNELC
jgi:hypothetical protein